MAPHGVRLIDPTAMSPPPLVPDDAALRQAISWLAEHHDWTAAGIDEASRMFDLSPADEEFLLREARRMRDAADRTQRDAPGGPDAPTTGR